MEKSTVKERLKAAVRLLYEKDIHLFVVDAHECSLTSRLGLYLQQSFPDYQIDCEYNREGEVAKTNEAGDSVRPDILIHERGTNEHNLLAIEAKKKPENDYDQKKLMGYIQKQNYAYAVSIVLPASGTYKIKWVEG